MLMQSTDVLRNDGSGDMLDGFAVANQFQVPIPADLDMAESCALIFKLRHKRTSTETIVSRCWAPLELRDILHQHGMQNVTIGLYQKPTDLRRIKMHVQGQQSKLVLQVQPAFLVETDVVTL